MSTVYKQERNHPNWTGRVPRQSRITGTWAEQHCYPQKEIPVAGYVFGVFALVVLFLAAYL